MNTVSKQKEYWTAHGPRFMKLEESLSQILAFIKKNPSEFILLNVAAEWSPMNDWRPGGWFYIDSKFPRKEVVQPRLSKSEFD